MSSVFELMRNSPFGGPVSHAKCQGLKVNDGRTVAALAAGAGSGTDDDLLISRFVPLIKGILSTVADLSCTVQGQISL